MRLATIAGFTTIVCLAAGCAPYPHRVFIRPEVTGTLSVGGVPARGAQVFLGTSSDQREPCKAAVAIGTTDDQGGFVIAPLEKTVFFYSAINAPDTIMQLTNVCFGRPDHPVELGAQLVVKTAQPSTVSLSCDPTLPAQRSPLSISQICRVSASAPTSLSPNNN